MALAEQEAISFTTEGCREALKTYNGKRIRVYGDVNAFGAMTRTTNDGRQFLPVLIRDLRHCATNELLVDHIWLPIPHDDKGYALWAKVRVGDRISFAGLVEAYVKGSDRQETKRLDFAFKDIGFPAAYAAHYNEVTRVNNPIANGDLKPAQPAVWNLDRLEPCALALPLNDMRVLHFKLGKAIEQAEDQAAKLIEIEARAFMIQKAKEAGISAERIANRFAPPPAPVPALKRKSTHYVNPKNPGETWSGVGRRPVWLQNQLAAGRELHEFRS